MNSKDDKKITSLFKEVMRDELDLAQVKREKQAFIASHFKPAPVAWLTAPVLAPAMAVLMVFLVIGYQHQFSGERTTLTSPQSSVRMSTDAVAARQVENEAALFDAQEQPSVKVRKASSHVGPVMVYQRQHNEVPITIVWVFAQGPLIK